jgi:hypothetical protein
MSDFYPTLVSEPETRRVWMRLTGAGTGGAVSKVFGSGVRVTYAGVGLITLTWDPLDDRIGQPIGPVGDFFQSTVPANVKGYDLVAGLYAPTTKTMALNIYDGANNLIDLKVNEFVTFEMVFRVYKV